MSATSSPRPEENPKAGGADKAPPSIEAAVKTDLPLGKPTDPPRAACAPSSPSPRPAPTHDNAKAGIAGKPRSPFEAQAKADLALRNANDAAEAARAKLAADQAELARLESGADLRVDASDAEIEKHLHAKAVAQVRASLAAKALAAVEETARKLADEVAAFTREAAYRQIVAEQAAVIDRFRAAYGPAMSTLFRLFQEAHAVEAAGWKIMLDKTLPLGAQPYASVFGFNSPASPITIRVQIFGGADDQPLWQGDQNSDLASQMI